MKIGGGDGGFDGKGGDLSESMDSGIGSSCSLWKDHFAGDVFDRLGERALHGGEAGLNLPAMKWCSIVGEDCLPKRHTDVIGRYHAKVLNRCRWRWYTDGAVTTPNFPQKQLPAKMAACQSRGGLWNKVWERGTEEMRIALDSDLRDIDAMMFRALQLYFRVLEGMLRV